MAVVFSGLGDKENALYWLGKAQQLHVSDLIGIGKDPHFVELRSDRRFQALVQQARRAQMISSVCFPCRPCLTPVRAKNRYGRKN